MNMYEFGEDILDCRDILKHQRELLNENPDDVEFWEREKQEYLALVAEIEDQLWTSLDDYARNEPTLIKDTYFVEYAQMFARDVQGVDDDMEWPFNYIDWDAAADELKQGYFEIKVGDYTYYAREY